MATTVEPQTLHISPEEIGLMEALVYHEAAGEGREGRDAVRAVLYNRLASPQFPNTAVGVMNQRNQFEPVGVKGEGSVAKLAESLPLEVIDAGAVEHGDFLKRGEDPTEGATFFQSTNPAAFQNGTAYNQGYEPDKIIGNHAFYRHYEGNPVEPVAFRVALDGEFQGDVRTGRRVDGAASGTPVEGMMHGAPGEVPGDSPFGNGPSAGSSAGGGPDDGQFEADIEAKLAALAAEEQGEGFDTGAVGEATGGSAQMSLEPQHQVRQFKPRQRSPSRPVVARPERPAPAASGGLARPRG